jgi:hypothetical protein
MYLSITILLSKTNKQFWVKLVLEVFAQGWQVNLSFLSVSPVHIIPALHEVQILLYICSQKMACHTKGCYMT